MMMLTAERSQPRAMTYEEQWECELRVCTGLSLDPSTNAAGEGVRRWNQTWFKRTPASYQTSSLTGAIDAGTMGYQIECSTYFNN